MRVLGKIFMFLFIAVLILGFYIGIELSRFELDYSNPMRDMPLNNYEFNLGMALIVWLPGLSLLITALVFYWMDSVADNLAGMQSVLKDMAGDSKKALKLATQSADKKSSQENYSKPGDAPGYPRSKGESDSDYWDRVTKGQHSVDIQSKEDDPRYPRHSGELDDEYWKRVGRASSIQDGYKY